MIRIDWQPGEAKLRQFGWISLVGFGLLASMAWFRFGSQPVASALCGLAVLAPVIGMLRPGLLKFLYLGLSLLALPIGFVVSNLLLLSIFLLVFTPVALIFRLIGRDELRLRLTRAAPTYWNTYDPEKRNPSSYYRPF